MPFNLAEVVQSEVHEVVLPSKGVLYRDGDGNELLPGGVVKIRPISSSEEEILISLGFTRRTTYLITEQCLSDESKAKVPFKDMLVGDVVYLFFELRALTYGKEFSFDHLCMSCMKPSPVVLQIPEDLGLYVLGPDFKEPFEAHLPVCNQTALLRLLRMRDEDEIDKYVEGYEGPRKDPGHGYRMAKYITAVGAEPVTPKNFNELLAQVRAMHGKDSEAIRDAVNANDVGVDIVQARTCPLCGKRGTIVIEFGPDFFRSTPSPVRRGRGPL